MRGLRYALVVALVCVLGACTSAPPEPATGSAHAHQIAGAYWDDRQWDMALLKAVQSAVLDPIDVKDLTVHGIHGVVHFTVVNGDIEYPDIAESTGDPELDKLMLRQVASARIPPPTGPHAQEPHEFALPLYMPTPFESFELSVFATIDRQKVYPKNPIIGGKTGNNTIDFDYVDGKISNLVMTKTSNNRELDEASTNAVTRAVLPSAPAPYAAQNFHMEVVFCYSLEEPPTVKNPCPQAINVIPVIGTRIKRVEVYGSRL